MEKLTFQRAFIFLLEESIVLKQDNVYASSASVSRSSDFEHCCPFLFLISVLFSVAAAKLGPRTAGFFHASQTLALQHRWQTMLSV